MGPFSAFVSRGRRLGAFGALASAVLLGTATAQTTDSPGSSAILNVEKVPAGDVVYVTDNRRVTVKAVFAGVTSDAIELILDGEMRTIAAGQVQRIQWQQPDSWLTGALVGAGIGAIPGVYYAVTDPNECAGLCPEEYALIGIGALVGGLVDWAIKEKITVYERPGTGSMAPSLFLAPVLTPGHRAVQVTLRF